MSYYKKSPVINSVIQMMQEATPLIYTKKTKSATLRNQKVVGITLRCLLRYELIVSATECEMVIVYALSEKGLSFKVNAEKKVRLNFKEMDLADILKHKLRESQRLVIYHEGELRKAKEQIEFHKRRVEYLTAIIEEEEKILFYE